MTRRRVPYRQALPALQLSIERYTPAVPDDGAWYLLRDGDHLGRYRTLAAAKEAWDHVVAESGWEPAARPTDPGETLLRERRERWARNRAG
jgi:hypothetical protein